MSFLDLTPERLTEHTITRLMSAGLTEKNINFFYWRFNHRELRRLRMAAHNIGLYKGKRGRPIVNYKLPSPELQLLIAQLYYQNYDLIQIAEVVKLDINAVFHFLAEGESTIGVKKCKKCKKHFIYISSSTQACFECEPAHASANTNMRFIENSRIEVVEGVPYPSREVGTQDEFGRIFKKIMAERLHLHTAPHVLGKAALEAIKILNDLIKEKLKTHGANKEMCIRMLRENDEYYRQLIASSNEILALKEQFIGDTKAVADVFAGKVLKLSRSGRERELVV